MKRRCSVGLLALLYLLIRPSASVAADTSELPSAPLEALGDELVVEPPTPPDANIALVASGGVSLGAYQAGFLYMALSLQQQRQPDRRLALAAGTSAGSANALISALNSCRGTTDDPQDDLGWRVWVPLGVDQLFEPERVTPVSIFTRDGLRGALDAVWETWKEGLPESCDVVVAFTVTRLKAYGIEIRPGLVVPRQEERIRLRIRGRGDGVPPALTNYVDPHYHLKQMVLNLRMDDHRLDSARHNFDQLVRVIFASTSFPVAFEPQPLDYCLLEPVPREVRVDPVAPYCPEPTYRDLFIDGGVFENYPLRLAESVVADGLRADRRGRTRWRDLTAPETADAAQRRPEVFYAYVDPFNPAYPPMTDTSSVPSSEASITALVGSFTSNFIAAARGRELYGAVEADPTLTKHMFISRTSYPTASEPIAAFMGFMDRQFRAFDYYLGMYDALVLVNNRVLPGGALPLADDVDAVRPDWRPFACMLGMYDPAYDRLQAACSGVALPFLTLLQVSIDRVHDHCRRIPPAELNLRRPHPRCEAAAQGRRRPTVPGVPPLQDSTVARQDGEAHFRHGMRLLSNYGFVFADLGLPSDHPERGRLYVRRKLVEMGDALAAAQPSAADRAIVRSGIRAITDPIAYDPPKLLGWAMIGTVLEGGLSTYPSDGWPSWLRFAAALQYVGWTSLFSDEKAHFIGALVAGPEFELQFISSSLFSPYLGVRGGGQLSTLDGMGGGSCDAVSSLGDGRNCSQAVVQAYAAVSALRWLRMQVELDVYPTAPVVSVPDLESGDLVDERRFVGFQFSIGAQFY